MGSTHKTSHFYKDKPLFGLDIGYGSLKVMQVDESIEAGGGNKSRHLVGYGTAAFTPAAIEDGVIVDPKAIAASAQELFKHHLIGDITTRRVAFAIPSYRTFTRSLQVPKLKAKELREAVELEAEQYVSLPLEELYLDYEIIRETTEGTELFAIAVPRKIVDSYVELATILGLETVLIEATLSSAGRLFKLDKQQDAPTAIIDFGSKSADISLFDNHVLVTGTVQGGGVVFSESIRKKLGVSVAEAGLIKTKYGLGASKKQTDIVAALTPTLEQIVKEIRRMIRYYEERYGTERPISQVITLGGGANMPGLSEYLTNALRLAVRHTDPWQYLKHEGLQPPSTADKPMYATVAGLSLVNPKEVFRS